MAFPSLSQLFPSVYKPETYFCLVFEFSPQFRNQDLSLSFQHVISSFKHSYSNVKYFGIVLAFQDISWARTLVRVTKKEAHGISSATLLQSQCFGTHSVRGIEVYSTHINILFEAWLRHWSLPVLFSTKLRTFRYFGFLSPCTEVFITEELYKHSIFQTLRI